jgi:TRAP-type mannitol/chloroaromatic compound transport system substrate-binding protein
MKKIIRRDFIKTASTAAFAATATGLLAGCAKATEKAAPGTSSKETFNWKMVTAWPPHFPLLGTYADAMADWIGKMSDGRLNIHVYGGGELVPPLETFDAVSQGVSEMGHGGAYYWSGKVPAAQFFSSVPFGMNTVQFNAWLYEGGGLELYEEVYKPFNILPIPAGNTGAQMGGWFNKQINSVSDLHGLKMRIAGLGGKVIDRIGGTPILAPAGELYTDLDRGVIDALEWVGPYHDYLLGFNKIAKYYYYPGWQEPTAGIELLVNIDAFNQLPKDLQIIVKTAGAAAAIQMLSDFEAKNSEYYQKLKYEEKIDFRKFPDEVLAALKKATGEVLTDIISSNKMCKKVYDSYSAFQKNITEWNAIVETNNVG